MHPEQAARINQRIEAALTDEQRRQRAEFEAHIAPQVAAGRVFSSRELILEFLTFNRLPGVTDEELEAAADEEAAEALKLRQEMMD